MKYFKSKKVQSKGTTLDLITLGDETRVQYENIDEVTWNGVNTNDETFLARQYAECEVEELAYEQIKPILDNCRLKVEFQDLLKKYPEKAEEFTERMKELGLIQ